MLETSMRFGRQVPTSPVSNSKSPTSRCHPRLCEVPLVVEVARPTERSLFGETTQFVPVSSANKKPTDHNSLFLLFNFMKKIFYRSRISREPAERI